jgi:Lon-like protease
MLRRRWVQVSLLVAALVVAAFLVLVLVPSNDYIILPDRVRATDPLVHIPGERSGTNGIYMVDVHVRRATLLEKLFPEIYEGATLVPERQVNPAGVSEGQLRQQGLNQMSRSQLVAITVALRELGRKVSVRASGAQVVLVEPGAPADGVLEVGDLIVEADGERVATTRELRRAFADVEPGDEVTLVVRRGRPAERVRLTVGTKASPEEPARAIVGVQVQDAEDFDFPLDIRINAGSIGGPSAGLAFALDIVDDLGPDIDRGRTIVATGALALDGHVGAIGGVEQKAIAAKRAGADVFLVPDANAADARKAEGELNVVAVSTFDEALSSLSTR